MNKRPIGYTPGKRYFQDYKPIKNPVYSKKNTKCTFNIGHTVDQVKVICIYY